MNNQKKKRSTKILALLFVCAMLTLSFAGSTFAKYLTTGTVEDSAQVAAWGVNVVLTNMQIFSDKYAKDDSTATDIGNNSVVSGTTSQDVVAPGTTGTLAGISLTGKPEVAGKVTFAFALELGNRWMVDVKAQDGTQTTSTFYCPITITIGDQTLCGLSYTSADEFQNAVAAVANAYTVNFEAGKDLSTLTLTGDNALKVTWAWLFDAASTGTENYKIKQTDGYDTQLGDKANAGTPANIKLTVTVKVEQID